MWNGVSQQSYIWSPEAKRRINQHDTSCLATVEEKPQRPRPLQQPQQPQQPHRPQRPQRPQRPKRPQQPQRPQNPQQHQKYEEVMKTRFLNKRSKFFSSE